MNAASEDVGVESGWGAAAAAFVREPAAQESQENPEQLSAATVFQPRRRRGRPRKADQHQDSEHQDSELALVPVAAESAQLALAIPKVRFHQERSQWPPDLSRLQQLLLASASSHSQPALLGIDGPALPAMNTHEDDTNPRTMCRFLKRCFNPASAHTSRRVLEELVGGRTQQYHEITGSAVLESGHAQWSILLKQIWEDIKSNKYTGLLFLKQRSYDETPLHIRHGKLVDNTARITKVMQSHFHLAMILQENETGNLIVYSGAVPTWLQGLQEKKGEDIMQSQLDIENSVSFLNNGCSELFALAIQLVTTDRDNTNYKAEVGINRYFPHFAKMHLPCDVHKLSTCITNMFKIASSAAALTGIVNMGLLFRPAGALASFRKCIEEELASKLRVVIGPPLDGYEKSYRHEVYKQFLDVDFSNDVSMKRHRALRVRQVEVLNFFLNGDLQDENTIVWYSPFPIEREVAVQLVCKYVPYALLPSPIAVFPRHRWHGFEVPVDQLGILASHHNLLKHATLRFLKLFSGQSDKPRKDVTASGGWGQAASDVARLFLPNPLQPPAELPPLAIADGEPQDEGEQEDGHQDQGGDGEGKPTTWEEINRSIRGRVRHWVLQDMGDNYSLPLLRFAFGPMVQRMFATLKISGKQWDLDQESSELQTGSRKYRILEAFLGLDIEETFQQMSARLHTHIPALPMKAHNRRSCATLFILIVRLAGSMHFLIRYVRSGFPYKVFSCLSGSSQQVADSPSCLYDAVTCKLVEQFGVDGLTTPKCLAVLRTLAEVATVDIARVESKHASIRRVLEGSSVQTWRANLAKLSADFVLRRGSISRKELSQRMFVIGNKSAKKPGPPKKTRKGHRKGGGGAHRAFMREKLLNLDPSRKTNRSTLFRSLNAEYRQLNPEEKAVYKDIGEAASLSHRTGYRAFGSKRRSPKLHKCKGNGKGKGLSNAISTRISDLEVNINRKRKELLTKHQELSHQQKRQMLDIAKFCRKEMGLDTECAPIAEEEAFERCLSETCVPRVSTGCKSFELLPPNVKLAKD